MAELRAKTDILAKLQDKMREFMKNGARLGWLIDPQNQQVAIYRAGQDVEILAQPRSYLGKMFFQALGLT